MARTLCPVSNYYQTRIKPDLMPAEAHVEPFDNSLEAYSFIEHSSLPLKLTPEQIVVSVSSASPTNVTFTVTVSIEEEFYIK